MADYSAPKMFIAGAWTDGQAAPRDVINPATEEVLGVIPSASPADLDRALASTRAGFVAWKSLSAEKRCEILLKGCRILRERALDLAPRVTLEQGKPLAEAKAEILRAAEIMEWDANEGRRAYGTVVPGEPGFVRMGLRLPVGPVAGFSPWNVPVTAPARKIGAALAAGCSIVIKGAEETPASCAMVVEALLDGGVPPEAINMVFGEPAHISAYLIASPVIRAITFTGSIPVGKHLAGLAARHMKPAVMELGGHAPVIVCNDADVLATATQGAAAKYRNAGQVCTSPTRFIVHESQYDAFVERFAAAASAINVGNGLEASSAMGPLAHDRRIAAMEAMVSDAVAKGARIAAGGARIGNRGYFFQPTVLADVPDNADVANNEPFGPIAVMRRFSDLDEAISVANRLPYGLSSFAFTRSQVNADKLATSVESGIMSINHFGTSQPDTPFGGVKDSGYGREGGYATLDAFLHTKFVSYKVIA